jgi:peptidyl-prolyl cis-trans isomerase A (cyclophilin A)
LPFVIQPSLLRAAVRACLGAALGALLLSSTAPVAAQPAGVLVTIVTDKGPIVVALDPVHAPVTVKNFLHYVDTKFYNGGTFFRVIPGFVIQGGNKLREKPSDPKIPLEGPVKTGLQNKDGAISMARTADPDSATSEFFICDGDQPNLDGSMTSPGYAAFGHVVKGMDLVRAIARLPAAGQFLTTPIKIIKITRG